MHKGSIQSAALLSALAVILGALGAHTLKEIFAADTMQIFETAVRYQIYHALALLAVGILYKEFTNKQIEWAGRLFIAGIILFSGSLYAICYLQYINTSVPVLIGILTPLGGLCFILGWMFLFIGVSKK